MFQRPIPNSHNLLLGLSLAAIGGLTLIPLPDQSRASALTSWHCLVCGDTGMADVLLNIALFVPLGLALGLKRVRPSRTLLIGVLLSTAIELLQATLVAGRDPSISDVLTNTMGTLAGGVIGRAAPQLWLPTVARARQLAALTALAWLGMVALSAVALTDDPANGVARTVQAPPAPLLERFKGEIISTGVDATTGAVALTAEVRTAGLTDRLAPILDLSDGGRFPLARLGQLGQKPTFARRLRATRALFRTPTVRVYGGVIPAAPSRALLQGGKTGPMLWSAATIDGSRHSTELVLTPGLGWMLLLPLGYPFDVYSPWTSAVWLALPLLLVGFWAGRGRVQVIAVLAGSLLLLTAGLEGTAALFHLGSESWLAWVMGLGAIVGGWGLGLRA